jgi:hypothetical protein
MRRLNIPPNGDCFFSPIAKAKEIDVLQCRHMVVERISNQLFSLSLEDALKNSTNLKLPLPTFSSLSNSLLSELEDNQVCTYMYSY